MDEHAIAVLHGFFNLPNLEKLKVVETINEYFDSNDREPIRQANDERFAGIDFTKGKCPCCGR